MIISFQLLIALSISDTFLIAFFIVTSVCVTVSDTEPQWFTLIFSKVLWPLGNIYITVSVLLVVAVSTERYLAICRPLQYKPKAIFFIVLVFATSVSVNTGRFFEFRTEKVLIDTNETLEVRYSFAPTEIMSDERYIMFSRYWTEILVTGVLPLLALVFLNYGIYTEIRNSAKFRQSHDGYSAGQIRNTSHLQIRSTLNVNNFKNINNLKNINNFNDVNLLNVRASSASTLELSSSRNLKTENCTQQKSDSLTSFKSETIVAITHNGSMPSECTTQVTKKT